MNPRPSVSLSKGEDRKTNRSNANVEHGESQHINSNAMLPYGDYPPLSSSTTSSSYHHHFTNVSSTVSAASLLIPNQQMNIHSGVQHLNVGQRLSDATVPTIQRSSPIAIMRQPGNDRNEMAYDSDAEDDYDDSEIDVEKDAMKLQKKYGANIGLAQTYQPPSALRISAHFNSDRTMISSVLNAPYLGSLSRSANQVVSLPPMSLAGDPLIRGARNEDPPEAIGSYGSLRDSHERGRFLDGPSSYREPTSGRIRQLEHRLRYHGSRTSTELSIGERMQQSRKLKDIQRNEESKQKDVSAKSNDTHSHPVAQSSLSAMMNEVSNFNSSSRGDDANPDSTSSIVGKEIMMPIKADEMPTYRDHRHQKTISTIDSTSMLSTSLTAYEMLKMSNVSIFQSSLGLIPASSTTSAAMVPSPAFIGTSQRRFQPLSRSMSDPMPRMQPLSLWETSTTAATEGQGSSSGRVGPVNQFSPGKTSQQPLSLPFPPALPMTGGLNDYELVGRPPVVPDHDPDVDGAFGDMDMD